MATKIKERVIDRFDELEKLYNKYGYTTNDRLVYHHPLESYLNKDTFHPLFNFATMLNFVLGDNKYNGRIVARIFANPYYGSGMKEEDYVMGKYPLHGFHIDLDDYTGVNTFIFFDQINECTKLIIDDFRKICEKYGKNFELTESDFFSLKKYLSTFVFETFEHELHLALILRKELVNNGFI